MFLLYLFAHYALYPLFMNPHSVFWALPVITFYVSNYSITKGMEQAPVSFSVSDQVKVEIITCTNGQ